MGVNSIQWLGRSPTVALFLLFICAYENIDK